MKLRIFLSLLLLVTAAGRIFSQYDSILFSGMKARSIGPAGMSGRIAAIDAVISDPNIIYVGAATGGVWKSTNNGVSWTPIFEEQNVSSIGAIAICQSNPNIIWVGTGESNVRNSAGVGRGVFKSLDAGKTWMKMGLEKTEKFSRIILNPGNPDIAYAAALGTTWGENSDRGVFKTTDGGKTWQKILYVDEKTGAADLAIDPNNPNKLIASMWEHRRWPWFFKSGGPGSAIYITTDGGDKWKKLSYKDGLPEGDIGRVGLAFAASRSNIVYALVEAKKNVLLRSEDGGFKWKIANQDHDVDPRPFYFGRVMVNPKNENMVYRLEFLLSASEDAGKTFKGLSAWSVIHPDYHALWIHPNGEFMIAGNDGGIAMSYDRGKSWKFVQNLPLGQFYHISFDDEFPYHVYGGLQDNGSYRGPSNTFKKDGIYNDSWEMVGFGDGFATVPDPENSQCGYAMSQAGNLFYYDSKLGIRKDIRPTEHDVKDRYNWNAGFALDPFDVKTIYYGSQFLHKSLNKGDVWELISPDLTTNDSTKLKQAESGGLTQDATGAENHCSILTIAPSPIRRGVIWVGTDDGNLQVTQDGGKTWTNTIATLRANRNAPPQATWCPHVEASRFDAATAYVVFDDHRRSNWKSYVFVTHDFGKTWENLATPEIDGFAHVLVQDPVNKDLLFLGTEFGLHVSLNGGKNWMKWTAGIPTVPVLALGVHPRENDLVIGTHGRGIYILDDITPLRKMSQEISVEKFHLFDCPRAFQYHTEYWAGPYTSSGDGMFKGKQRDYGAIINYVVNPPDSTRAMEETPKEMKLKIEILSGDSVIRVIRGPMKKGINRVAWDLSRGNFHTPVSSDSADVENSGILVLPGVYKVRIQYAGKSYTQTIEVKPDPRYVPDVEGRKQTQILAEKAGDMLETVAAIYKRIEETKKAIKTVIEFAVNLDSAKANVLKRTAEELQKKLAAVSKKIEPEKNQSGINDFEELLSPKIQELIGAVTSTYGSPTQGSQVKYEKLSKSVKNILNECNALYEQDVAAFQNTVRESGFSVFKSVEKLKMKE
jgi:photosystem II stability/assembly factor-like uncharacterized protein